MTKTRRHKYNNNRTKSKKMIGGGDERNIFLGITTNLDQMIIILGSNYTGRKDKNEINKYLKEYNFKLQLVDCYRSQLILGYPIENFADRDGNGDGSGWRPIKDLIHELRVKTRLFKKDIKQLNPKLKKVTLVPWEGDEVERPIEPMLLLLKQ